MSSSRISGVLDEVVCTPPVLAGDLLPITDGDRRWLIDALAAVPDPRRRRGLRYPFLPLLSAAVCAMLAGARSFAAIAEWVADLPEGARATLGLTGSVPGTTTIWRLLVALDADALQSAVGGWVRTRLAHLQTPPDQADTPGRRPRRVLAVDGKAMRATRHGAEPVHLLAALDHATGVVVTQVDVDVKTNEIPCFSTLLDQVEDPSGVVVSADALHAQTAHADYLHGRGAHLLVTVKGNQPSLRSRLTALPWKSVPVGHASSGRGHGRIERRTVKAVTVPAGLGFPHATQAIQVIRKTRPIKPAAGRPARWRTRPFTRSARCQPSRLNPPNWLPGSAPTGRSRTGSTGSAT